ncbi:MAG: response regulator [Gemmatimonadota bacterium]
MAVILVVDDDPSTRVLLNALLGDQLGHELVYAGDGEAALDTFERVDPDLVITDLVMPKLNGHRLIAQLREMDRHCRIIAISGKAPEQLERAENAGALASLVKPLSKGPLQQIVQEVLARPVPRRWRG